MHKLTLLLLLVLPFSGHGQENNFQYTQHDLSYTGDTTAISLHGDISNLSNADISLTITPVELAKPDGWQAYYCLLPLVCLPMEFVPSHTFNLKANESVQFSFDVQTFELPGEGEWMIYAVDSASMEIDSAHVRVGYLTAGVSDRHVLPDDFSISRVFPNPLNAQLNFQLEVPAAGEYQISLQTIQGRHVLSQEYALSPGTNLFSWNVRDLASGSYLLIARHGGEIHSRKVVVVK